MRLRKDVFSKPNKVNKKKSKPIIKFIARMFIISFVSFVALICIITGLVGGAILGYIKTATPLTAEQLMLKGFTSCVYDSKDNLIMQLYVDKNREMIDSKDIPQKLKFAFVAIEDKRFYEHYGIDFVRIGSAVVNFIKPGSSKYGASTITQQVVKNITGQDERSLKRKIQEQWKALELEKQLSKDQILEIYLNIIYMGENCYGVQAASKMYFNKDAKDLTLGEGACLAGITNLPGTYDPFLSEGKENNLKRQKIILKEMLSMNFITQDEYNNAIAEQIKFAERTKETAKIVNTQPYFVDQVIIDVKKDLMAKGYSEDIAIKMIYNNGLKIYSTMDSDVQKAVNEVFENMNYFPVISKVSGQPQGAMVILDAKNSEVRALYGGAGLKKGNTFNRASSTMMQRQPGSTFKPIAVYGPAIDRKLITPATVIDDVPVYMLGSDKGRYPENYDQTYRGLTDIQDAIRDSINVVASKTWKDYLGPDMSLKYLSKVGIDRSDERYVSIAMGGLKKGVNPLQMAAAYVPFVNKGIYCEPITYTKVEDSKGNVILEKKHKNNTVYDEASAFIMTHMLEAVPKLGTAYPYGLLQNGQIPTAGKTGTTSDNKDKWYVGFSPYYVGATWYGYDKPTTLSSAEYNRALIIWHDVMERVHKNLKTTEFSMPSNIVKKTICIYSGKVPTKLCYSDPRNNSIREEYFISGTEPKDNEPCDVHVSCKVCKASSDAFGRYYLAGQYCPSSLVGYGVFVHRKNPYIAQNADDPYPFDWKYEEPAYCRVHGAGSVAGGGSSSGKSKSVTPEASISKDSKNGNGANDESDSAKAKENSDTKGTEAEVAGVKSNESKSTETKAGEIKGTDTKSSNDPDNIDTKTNDSGKSNTKSNDSGKSDTKSNDSGNSVTKVKDSNVGSDKKSTDSGGSGSTGTGSNDLTKQ